MTQKELLYVEDAVGHEENIIKILEESIAHLDNQSLVKFLKKEIKDHEVYKTKLMKLLEVMSNE